MQETLKTKGYFYGAPTGVFDADTHSAVRRFQIHEGLPVSGELDGATAKALGVAPVGLKRENTTVSKAPAAHGESAGPLQETDREFLRRMEEQTPPERVTVQPTPEPVIAPPRPPVPQAPPPVPRQPIPPARASNLAGEVTTFVTNYLVAGAGADVNAELGLYAGAVDYFNDGRVNRAFIRRDTTNYRRRWPQRDYLLEGKPVVASASADGNTVTVKFRLRYRVRAGLQSATGRTETTMDLVRGPGGGFEIVGVREVALGRRD